MEILMHDSIDSIDSILLYIDDFIVVASDFPTHLEGLREVF